MPSSRSASPAVVRLIAADRQRRLAAELARPRARHVVQLVVGHDAVDEADLVGLVGGDRVAGEVELQRPRRPDEPRQALRAAEAGDDAEVDLGLAEARRLRGDPHVAAHRQLAAAAVGHRVDRGDRDRRRSAPSGAAARARRRAAPRRSCASSFVNALMSAPAHHSIGFAEAMISARIDVVGVDVLPHARELLDDLRRQRVRRRAVQPGDRVAVARLELHGLALLEAVVGLLVGEEALAGLRAEAALRDEPAQDQRRRELLAPLVGGALERGEHVVEAGLVGARERRRDEPRAGHHAEVDVAHGRHAVLEHEAGLDERLQDEALRQLVVVEVGRRRRSAARRSRRSPCRSSRRARRPRRAASCPGGRRRTPRRRTPAGARRRAAPCRGRAGR